MIELIGLLAAGASALGGFIYSRRFVRDRLRFVDMVQRRSTPWLAGGVALVAAAPVVAVLPIVGGGTALLFGAAVGYGVHKGARDAKGRRDEIMVV